MSHQMRPKQTLTLVCDLCDEPISTANQARVASLVTYYGGIVDRAQAKSWRLYWAPRSWPGFRAPSWQETQREPEKYRERRYDFHTECILQLVEDAIAKREASTAATDNEKEA